MARWRASQYVACLLSCLIAVAVGKSTAAADRPINLQQLQSMFAEIRAKTKWNVDGPLLWGYFFVDQEAAKLQPIASTLDQRGYRVDGIRPSRDSRSFVLHVEKVEHHTPETLDRRNQEFYELAEAHKIRSYDGMDVGPPTK
jgi:hypothetical protein